jgi:hypothetical protein
MKNLKTITLITLIFCVVVLFLTILDFAALHDIKQDYVSKYILKYLNIVLSKELPDWTSTTGEWQIVTISLFLRFFYFILNILVLLSLIRKVPLNKENN